MSHCRSKHDDWLSGVVSFSFPYQHCLLYRSCNLLPGYRSDWWCQPTNCCPYDAKPVCRPGMRWLFKHRSLSEIVSCVSSSHPCLLPSSVHSVAVPVCLSGSLIASLARVTVRDEKRRVSGTWCGGSSHCRCHDFRPCSHCRKRMIAALE